ncbi:hypothetical protein AAES_23949 [Amazona aestiva]|uniref:Uncharacterized protein n=1 Tax=Amazona aestiva TaxID=12930 RepID=A0A0Q3X3X2_AMAAE|nr:hypothetical protein AAES_23949 [Amazona aestiva]
MRYGFLTEPIPVTVKDTLQIILRDAADLGITYDEETHPVTNPIDQLKLDVLRSALDTNTCCMLQANAAWISIALRGSQNQLLLLTVASGDMILTGLMLMLSQDQKAQLSSECQGNVAEFKDAL